MLWHRLVVPGSPKRNNSRRSNHRAFAVAVSGDAMLMAQVSFSQLTPEFFSFVSAGLES